jgi:outer membrane protein TolC
MKSLQHDKNINPGLHEVRDLSTNGFFQALEKQTAGYSKPWKKQWVGFPRLGKRNGEISQALGKTNRWRRVRDSAYNYAASIVGRGSDPAQNLRVLSVCLLVLGSLWLTSSAAAQDVVRPEQVVRAALAHSPALQSAASEERAAAARMDQARAAGQFNISADARAAHYWGLSDQQLGPQITIPGIPSRYGAGLQATQPLFTGGRITSERAAAAAARDAAGHAQRGTEADVTLAALSAYWGWSKAISAVASFQAAVKRVERHNTDMQHNQKAGLVTESDALATTVQLENTRLYLTEAERRVETARAQLAYLMGRELPAAAQPLAATSTITAALPAETVLLQLAQTNRAELSARRQEVRAAEEKIEAVRADRRPQLAFAARYEQVRPNMLIIPPADEWNDDGFVGITASWNIFDSGLTRAKVAEATARRDQARQRQQQTADRIALEVRAARVDLANANERLAVALRAAESARRSLKVADDLWKNGLTRHVELLDAHAQLTAAEYQVIATRADLELAGAALQHATGRLKGSDGVRE